MNKFVWKFIKLAGVMMLLYMGVVQLIYKYSQDVAPYKRQQSPSFHRIQKKAEEGGLEKPVVDKLPLFPVVPVNSDLGHQADDSGPPLDLSPKRKYIHTLLTSPQQSSNYSHKPGPLIWPDNDHPEDDRIISQMVYGLPDVDPSAPRNNKKILLYSGLRDGMLPGSTSFKNQKCPVNECELTSDRSAAKSADLILWQNHVSLPGVARPPGQIWMIFFLESPYHTPSLSSMNGKVNWTSTYRRDSTMVAPYERFTLFNSSVTQLPLAKNYATGKTKKVAWFVSNCGARNNRLEYAKELSKHIQVDIFGACGSMSCPRQSKECFELLSTTYKFYLAFENSNCKDYITEKFFVNGLKNDVLPIVMGAHPDDYKRAAPKNSYIHVDDFDSPKHLAKYLHELDKDDDKYNEYFKWKGTGDNMNTYFWCRLCAMTHAADTVTSPHVYANVESWWRGASVCRELDNKHIWPRW